MDITREGESEPFKGAVHLALFGLCVAAGLYNVAALQARPSRRLAFNSLLYGALAAHEARQVLSHAHSAQQLREPPARNS